MSDEQKPDKKPDIEQEREKAKEEVKALEEDPPERLEDWPSGAAKYETFGGPEHETSYEESATSKLGPAEVRHHEDGSVSVGGDEVDDPDEYKGEPIPGGPTDPNAPGISGEGDTAQDEDEDKDEDENQGEDQDRDA
jgi:hypothetical protein